MKQLLTTALCLLCLQSKAQHVIDFSDTSKWVRLEPLKRTKINSSVYRQIYIYCYNDSVTIVDSPYLHGTLFSDDGEDDDTFRYVVSTWLFYKRNGKPINSVGRGQSSQEYASYLEYLERTMLWEIWMDRNRRDYWLYTYNGKRRRISFATNAPQRAFLTIK